MKALYKSIIMSSMLPVPVKVCEYCYSQSHINTTGFTSVRLGNAWFCHKFCHNLALLAMGEITQSDNSGYYKELIASKKKLFPEWEEKRHGETFTVSKITKNKEQLRRDKRAGKIRVIKQVFDITPQEELED